MSAKNALDANFSKLLYPPRVFTEATTDVISLTVQIRGVGKNLAIVWRLGDFTRNEPVTIDMRIQKGPTISGPWIDVVTMSGGPALEGDSSYGGKIGSSVLDSYVRGLLTLTGDITQLYFSADAWVGDLLYSPPSAIPYAVHPGGAHLLLDKTP